MMMQHYSYYEKNSSDDGAELLSNLSSYHPKKKARHEVNVVREIAHDNEQPAAQRDDEETVSAASTMTKWRGNTVPKKEAKALRHVFDDLQDHFGYQRVDPRVRFNNTSLHRLGNSDTWFGDMGFTYDINGEHCNLGYVGIDVCVDLTPKRLHKQGMPMLKDYGKSWVYVYVRQMTLDKVKAYVKTGTGWDVSEEGTVYDPNRNLVAIEAKMHHKDGQSRPSFWAVKDRDASGGDNMSFSRMGTVQDMSRKSDQQRIHRGVGIFSVSMEVEGSSNSKPTPGSGAEANLCFTLVSLRTWGITDCVAPIVHAPNKWSY
jgi:hypothetical protein